MSRQHTLIALLVASAGILGAVLAFTKAAFETALAFRGSRPEPVRPRKPASSR